MLVLNLNGDWVNYDIVRFFEFEMLFTLERRFVCKSFVKEKLYYFDFYF